MALDGNHPVGEAGHNTDHQLIDQALTAMPDPARVVGSDTDNTTLVLDPTRTPASVQPGEILVMDTTKVLITPATAPTATQVVTITPAGTQGSTPLANLTGGSGASAVAGPAVTARSILASGAATGRQEVFATHPNPPTVTWTASTASTITGAVRAPMKKRTSTLIDVAKDPLWDYPGARVDQLAVYQTDKAYANYLTGGASQNRRDYWRLRSQFYGQVIEFYVQPTTTTLKYRVMVDGLPLTVDYVTVSGVVAGTTGLVRVDFGAGNLGPRVIELEVNDPRMGGAWIGPTDSLHKWDSPQPMILGFGDSHTATGAGINTGNTWLRWAARHLSMDPVNMAVGGTGFLTAADANFRARLDSDIVSMAPDMVVFFGGYNDSAAVGAGTITAAQVGAEALYCYNYLKGALPNAVIIAAGPLQQGSTVAASMRSIDTALRASAVSAGIPYISFIDSENVVPTYPAWAASTAYITGDVKVNGGVAWIATNSHTSAATFEADRVAHWRSLTFNTGTGKSGTPTGDGNADVNVASDGIHSTQVGHYNLAYYLASQISRALRQVAA